MIGLNAPREQEIGAGPHIWVQWKNTELCADVHCACGHHSHIDANFAYALRCPECGQVYVVGTHVTLYPIQGADWDGAIIKEPS